MKIAGVTRRLFFALSVLAHGATSWIGSERYGAWYERRVKAAPDMAENLPVTHVGSRRRLQLL